MDYIHGHLCKHVHKVSITAYSIAIVYKCLLNSHLRRLTCYIRFRTYIHCKGPILNMMMLKCYQINPMVISLFYWLKIKFFIDLLCDENDDIPADDTDNGPADDTDFCTADDTAIGIKKTAGKFQKVCMNITTAYVYYFI